MGKPGFEYTGKDEITREIAEIMNFRENATQISAWLDAPGEHDYLGASLSTWVAGLRQLKHTAQEET